MCNTPMLIFENVIGIDEYQTMQAAFSLFKEFSNRPAVRNAKVVCRNHPLSAPRSDKDAGGEISVEKAIDAWCKDNDGKDISPDGFYSRWGVTRLGVPGRSSFFLRAARTCSSADKFNQWECKRALTVGMEQCDKGPETHGLAASVDCVDYSIDLSGVTYDGMPPWAEKEEGRKFPPPEDAEAYNKGGAGNAPVCDKGTGQRPLTDEDLNKAIDAFCQDGQVIKGYGKSWDNMFNFPPEKEPQFYPTERYKMHVTIGAESIENGGPQPYQDIRWCKYATWLLLLSTGYLLTGSSEYNWKLGKDDCTYALRKLYSTCTEDRAKNLNGGEYTYRCVKYKSWAVNTG